MDKACKVCGFIKDVSEFYKANKEGTYFSSNCKTCFKRSGYERNRKKCLDCEKQVVGFMAVRCKSCAMRMVRNTEMPERKLARKKRSVESSFWRGKHLPEYVKKKLSRAHVGRFSGEKSWFWIKDRSTLAKKQNRNDSSYYEWRRLVRNRDVWKCRMSNEGCEGKVVAHHILPWAKFPELRYVVDNGITLCRFHHPRKRSDEELLAPYLKSLVSMMVK